MEKEFEKLSLDENKNFNPNFNDYTIKAASGSLENVLLPDIKDIVYLNSKNNLKVLEIDEKKLLSFYDYENKIIDFTVWIIRRITVYYFI